MRPNSAAFGAQTAHGAAFAWDTHISAPHARTIASHPTNVRKGMRSASTSTAHNQEAQQATNTCTRERLQEPTIHRSEPRRAHQHWKPCDRRAREAQFGATDRNGFKKQGDDLVHKAHQDRDPSRWRRCRRLAAARTMMDSMSAPASTAPMNTSAI